MFTKFYWTREKLKPKYKIHDLVRPADIKKLFQKEIQPIGLINCVKLVKIIIIQCRVTVSTIYQKDIMSPY